ncbi:hypothetical protein JR316_0004450 [Psilocybe cubensis]|uniref:Uncharacterized protein n=2 Tax=Psilocybe cubensis TaxID=181762 RepID=A0ACB8H3X3_PSICU|nr:hypothetical protein JR316_0004450 [Psilocybe cubensis]KAH9482352.1 hypothetical protein JR316_0004450 [Psilocybe cubensis]
MASAISEGLATFYACKCLNVRINTSQPSSAAPECPSDPQYTPVFVQDDGISVTHPQVTVRIPSKPMPVSGTTKCSRFTTLACLLCNLHVYRVYQIISPDVEGNDSTLLPTEDWVEHEIMKSATGWIEVHKDTLIGENISQAEKSTSYAPYLSLLLPSRNPSPVVDEEETIYLTKPSSDEPPSYLSNLPPLFLPPPYTSSHPIFVLLAGLATKESQALRASAEQRIRDFVKAETAGIEMKEKELKSQVDGLWRDYREHLNAIQEERSNGGNSVRSPSSAGQGKDLDLFAPGSSRTGSEVSSSVKITSFVPQRVSSNLSTISQSLPRVSALSASLANSGFHHPRNTRRDQIEAESDGVANEASSSTLSTPRSGSSTLTRPRTAGISTQEFKRNLDENLNTQQSYRYFLNLEEEMARHKRLKEEELSRRQRGLAASADHADQVEDAGSESISTTHQTKETLAEKPVKHDGDGLPTRGRDKGKRKVTFDVAPAVMTAQSDGESTEGETTAGESESREMLFPLEDIDGEESMEKSTNDRHNTLPLLEQSIPRPINIRSKRPNPAFEAFASLRPASLPAPSNIRPVRSQPGVDSSSQGMLPFSRPSTSLARNEGTSRVTTSPAVPLSETDAALLKLVAAETPSHRGAWAPNSKAWQIFTRRQNSKKISVPDKSTDTSNKGADDSTEPSKAGSISPTGTKSKGVKFETKAKVLMLDVEDDKEDEYRTYAERGLPGSLRIEVMRPKQKEPLSLASYIVPSAMPNKALASVPSFSVNSKQLSAAAIRDLAYAERDRNRGQDPGPALDFTIPEDDEDEDDDDGDEAGPVSSEVGQKARKHALKIIQARNAIPEEGMWRSLA